MKKLYGAFLMITGVLITSSCASLMTTPFDQYPYAADGDAYIIPNGRLVHNSLKCPNIQSTSGYKRVSSAEAFRYDYFICSECRFMGK